MSERLTFDHLTICLHDDGTCWELGRGMTGVTYKAFDMNHGQEVALKVVPAGTICAEVFIDQARAAAKLQHPAIAPVYHAAHDHEFLYHAMELVDGETLQKRVERHGPMSPPLALGILEQVARALAAAERAHLVHREIKPADLMIVHDGSGGERDVTVKLIDPGWEEVEAQADGEAAPAVGNSPERRTSVRSAELRSDIYSLGCTLWFLLTGQSPFTGLLAQTLAQHLQREPAWERVNHLPTPVRKLLRIMLRRDPAERPRNAAELQSAIQLCRGSLERRSTLLRKLHDSASRSIRRFWSHRLGRKAAGIGALALLVAGGLTLLPDPGAGVAEPAVAVAEETASPSAAPGLVPAVADQSEPAPSGDFAGRPSNQRPPLVFAPSGGDEIPHPVFFDDEPEPIAALGSDDDATSASAKAVAKKAAPARTARHQASKRRETNPFVRVHRSVRDLLARVF